MSGFARPTSHIKTEMNNCLSSQAQALMLRAALVSMGVVQAHQFAPYKGQEMVSLAGMKTDGTLAALPPDRESDAAGKQVLLQIGDENIAIHGEESGLVNAGRRFTIYLDGLDGSMAFAGGASTSTVIVAAYDNLLRKVVYCIVGEPMTGRVWIASEGEPTITHCFGRAISDSEVICRVADGDLNPKVRVLLDSYPGFKRGNKVPLSTAALDKLHSLIQREAGLLMMGSNGLHHALVANGGKSVLGAVTTAIGGPWDVCPVLLVLQAGGTARAFRVSEDSLLLTECNPLAVAEYDILVTGNSRATVDTLAKFIHEARN